MTYQTGNWVQEKKGWQDEMVRHHWPNGQESEQIQGDSDG